jgi:hypothetical protein
VVQPIEDDIRAIGERATATPTSACHTLLAVLDTVFQTLQADLHGDREPDG